MNLNKIANAETSRFTSTARFVEFFSQASLNFLVSRHHFNHRTQRFFARDSLYCLLLACRLPVECCSCSRQTVPLHLATWPGGYVAGKTDAKERNKEIERIREPATPENSKHLMKRAKRFRFVSNNNVPFAKLLPWFISNELLRLSSH
jgi:hypothetical protein